MTPGQAQGEKVNEMRSRGRILLGLSALAVLPVAACGDIEDQSLCTVYGEFLAQREVVAELDIDQTSSTEAAGVAEDYLNSVRHLQEVVDTRYSAQLLDLELAATEVLRTLEAIPDDVDDSTWMPLIEDSLEDAANAAVTVVDAIEPQCPQTGDE